MDDPYRAPAASIDAGSDEADEAKLAIAPAGRWRRFFNLLIDYITMVVLSTAAVIAYSIAYFSAHPMAEATPMESWGLLADYAFGVAIMFAYYVPLERLFGCTLGKLVTGTRVVSEGCGRPSWGQVIGRTFARLIPFEAFSFLFVEDGRVRGWHDSLPRTWVVHRR
ncbi:MAG: RDD family protein [Luteimonas sp.]|nr:RDD family protein [Luteimonas sp.]